MRQEHNPNSRFHFLLISTLVDDTTFAVGSDAFSAALEVYAFAKAAGTGGGLDELRTSLGERFSKRKRQVADAPEEV